MLEILQETLIDTAKLLPFLLVTYLIMEAVERATAGKMATAIERSGPAGPLLGALLGVFPQCGFSAAASNFYSGGLIGLGTLIAVFMSTSDEMLPIFIANKVQAGSIFKILAIKVIIAAITGYVIFFLSKRIFQKQRREMEKHREEHGHDCSNDGHSLVVESIIRTLRTLAFIFVISLVLHLLLEYFGEELISSVLQDRPILGELIAGAVGLIPNCGASIAISELYLEGVIGAGAMMSGLLVSAGVGVLVLFEENHNLKENLLIMLVLYGCSVFWGILIQLLGITF